MPSESRVVSRRRTETDGRQLLPVVELEVLVRHFVGLDVYTILE